MIVNPLSPYAVSLIKVGLFFAPAAAFWPGYRASGFAAVPEGWRGVRADGKALALSTLIFAASWALVTRTLSFVTSAAFAEAAWPVRLMALASVLESLILLAIGLWLVAVKLDYNRVHVRLSVLFIQTTWPWSEVSAVDEGLVLISGRRFGLPVGGVGWADFVAEAKARGLYRQTARQRSKPQKRPG
jgi:hypothetical protein